jgi:hypothetical protein
VSSDTASVDELNAVSPLVTFLTPRTTDDNGGNGFVVSGDEAVQLPLPPITAASVFVEHDVSSVRNGQVGVSVSELFVDAPLTEPFWVIVQVPTGV